MKKEYQDNIVKYVADRLKEPKNISIHLPQASNEDIEYWQNFFSVVKREPFGYIYFE